MITPEYYSQGSFEPRKINLFWFGGDFDMGNVLKYINRAGKKTKSAKQDIQKAIDYIGFTIDNQNNESIALKYSSNLREINCKQLLEIWDVSNENLIGAIQHLWEFSLIRDYKYLHEAKWFLEQLNK